MAIAQVFGTALAGRARNGRNWRTTPIPLDAQLIAVLPCRGGEGFLRRLFEPLGYEVSATRHPLDETVSRLGREPVFHR